MSAAKRTEHLIKDLERALFSMRKVNAVAGDDWFPLQIDRTLITKQISP